MLLLDQTLGTREWVGGILVIAGIVTSEYRRAERNVRVSSGAFAELASALVRELASMPMRQFPGLKPLYRSGTYVTGSRRISLHDYEKQARRSL